MGSPEGPSTRTGNEPCSPLWKTDTELIFLKFWLLLLFALAAPLFPGKQCIPATSFHTPPRVPAATCTAGYRQPSPGDGDLIQARQTDCPHSFFPQGRLESFFADKRTRAALSCSSASSHTTSLSSNSIGFSRRLKKRENLYLSLFLQRERKKKKPYMDSPHPLHIFRFYASCYS